MTLTNNAAVLGGIWRLIESYGKDPEQIFRKLGLDLKLAENPSARIPYAKIEELWLEIIESIDDPFIGLKRAELWHPSTSGALGYACLASSSLRSSFQRIVRYLRVITEGMQCRIEEKNGEFSIIHSFHQDSLNLPEQADAILATLLIVCRINYGENLNPLAVFFTHPAPKETGNYYAFFRCPVNFDADDNRISFSQEVIDKKLPSSNPQLAQMNDQIMIEYLAKQNQSNIVDQVKVIIVDLLPSGKITDSSVADELHISRRTLHRWLRQENTTFSTILNEARKELATKYIQDPILSLKEISFLLGFTEYCSFSRAFKRWTGSTPSTVRSQL
jgi:AraC-like DNA-binding protein